MSQTLPLRALVKLSGLNTSGQRYSDKINSLRVATSTNTTIDFKMTSNAMYDASTPITIQGIIGLANPLNTTVNSITGTDTVTIVGTDKIIYPVSQIETFKIVDGSTYYYLRVYIPSGTTINAGSTVLFSDMPSPLTGINTTSQTVYYANPYTLLFRSTNATPFGINASNFPEVVSIPTPPNVYPLTTPLVTPGGTAKITLTQTNGYIDSSLMVATIALGGYAADGYLSDHNRQKMDISHEEIEQAERTVDGSLRFHHAATKRKFTISWNSLPADSSGTVDGNWGGNDILQIYKNNKGTFYLEIYNRDSANKDSSGPDSKILVRFADVGYSIVKRNFVLDSTKKLSDLWDISIVLEEC